MALATAASTLLVLLCLTAQSTAQVDCSNITGLINAGDCSFYDCLNTKFQCGPTDYPLAYGKRYCLRFASQSSCFTGQGQTWINNVRRCLMQKIVNSNLYNTNATCGQLQTFAFNSHPSCYTDNGFCSDILLSEQCKNLICLASDVFIWRDFLNKQAIAQVIRTTASCYSYIPAFLANASGCLQDSLVSTIYDYLNCTSDSLDIVIILDASGSIGSSNFQLMKNYIINMLAAFSISPDKTRVGVIRYSDNASIVIPLGSYNNYSSLSSAINSTVYTGGWTYTDQALNLLNAAFATARVDQGVPRVAIVFTDGQSTNISATVQAAQRAHDDGIFVYSFGIGSGINSTELTVIASGGQDNVFNVSSFSASDFQGVLKRLQVSTCITPSILEIGKDIVSVVAKGASRLLRYAFSKTLGMTIKIGIRLGDVLVRGSFSVQNPTELTQDFVAMSSKGVIDYFVSPEAYKNSTAIRITDGQRRKRQTMPNNVTNDELTLYLAVIGLNDNNTFTLNTTTGDTTESIPPSPSEIPTAGAASMLGSMLLVMAALLFVLFE